MSPVAAPLIVTAELGDADLQRVDALRRRYFPPERNVLKAHLTMFHALPPSVEAEVSDLLKALASGPRPQATIDGPYSMGSGVALRVRSAQLEDMRADIASRFHGLLTAQDRQGWRAHITIQNKVSGELARQTLEEVAANWVSGPLTIAGLGLHRYMGGPWETVGRYPFRG